MVIDHRFYMSLAIKEAWKYQGLTYPNPAVGALILDTQGKIVAIAAHQKSGSMHAELAAIEMAMVAMGDTKIAQLSSPNEKHAYVLAHHNDRFKGFRIYVTLEPCHHQGSTPPCSLLIKELHFSHLFCGVNDPNSHASGGIKMLQEYGLNVKVGIEEEACKMLITPFRKWQREEPFVFFKLALSANGVYDGGIITSKASRTLVHQMRDTIDLLVIGGETVRKDRPILDSRLINGSAPDILIVSKKHNFDMTIPLFQVPNRKVFIEDNFDRIKEYRFIMIEGAEEMLRSCESWIDWYCIFHSDSFKTGRTIQLSRDLQKIALLENAFDTITWFKPKNKGIE